MGTILTKKAKKMWWLFGLFVLLAIGFAILFSVGKSKNHTKRQQNKYTLQPKVIKIGNDEVTTCIFPKIKEGVYSYLDFTKMEDASFESLKKLVEQNKDYIGIRNGVVKKTVLSLWSRDKPPRPWRFYNIEGRTCKSKIPKNAKRVHFEKPIGMDRFYIDKDGNKKNKPMARYDIWVYEGKIVQIDGYLL